MNGKVTKVNGDFCKKISKTEVDDLTSFLRDSAKDFIEKIGSHEMEVFASTFLWNHVAKSYLLDVAKYKAFHDFPDKDINKYKVASYLVKWILKIRPIMVKKAGKTDSEKKQSIIINELFAFHLACLKCDISRETINHDLSERIIYNLHYRDYNVGLFNILLENL